MRIILIEGSCGSAFDVHPDIFHLLPQLFNPIQIRAVRRWETRLDVGALSTTKVTGRLYLPAMSARNSNNIAEVMLPVN